ncbi:MAG: DUF2179 domain-containing protein [Spirochaetes bacterium]|nr:DUF2179 domain-containing protein [Spirochaetota bacterium]
MEHIINFLHSFFSDYGTLFLIFIARIFDVSIGTMRIILMARGYRSIAPVLGFFEVLIWLVAINSALKHFDGAISYVVYAAGFATGNYVGMLLEEKIAIGYQSVRIITSKMVSALPLVLRQEGYGVTQIDGVGMKGPITLLFTVVPKRDVKKVVEVVQMLEPNAFITIEDVKQHLSGFTVHNGFIQKFASLISKKK